MTRDEWLDALDKLVYERVVGLEWTKMPGWLEGWSTTRYWDDAGALLDGLMRNRDDDWEVMIGMSHGGECSMALVRGAHTTHESFYAEGHGFPITLTLAVLRAHHVEIPEEPA